MRNTLVTSTILALALTGGLAARASAQTPPCTPNAGPFCIDGVITSTNNSGKAPQALFTPDPTGVKEFGPINGSTTKVGVINFATPPILGDTSITPKVDLTGVYTQAAVAGTDFWFYYAWNRATTSGSGFMAVEFERADKPTVCSLNYNPLNTTLLAGCNPWANRHGDGSSFNSDFMILWDQTGNAIGPQNIFVRFYNETARAFGVAQNLTLAGSAVAVYGGNGSDPSKGEMALNFSAITNSGANQCLTFANIIPNTVTGNSDTADYKDTVLSNFPVASNCGTVTVKKVTVPASSGISFQYTMADGTPMFGVSSPDSDCEILLGSNLNTCIGTVEHNVTDTITNLLQSNNYTLVESDKPSNYTLTSIICTPEGGSAVDITAGGTFPVAATKTTACVITNSLAKGDLKIIKVVVNGFGLSSTPGAFSYTVDGTSFYFTDTGLVGGTSCTSGSVCKTVSDSVGSTHTVLEPNPLTGYTRTLSSDQTGHANDCTDLTISSSPVTCTVTNTANQASPSAVTRQRVLLFDRANIAGVRRTAGDNGTMSVTFSLYADVTACGAQTGALASQSVPVTFQTGTDTALNGIPTTGGYEFKLDTAGDTGSIAHYWRAVFHQTGVNPPNADFTTPCTEITTVRIQQ